MFPDGVPNSKLNEPGGCNAFINAGGVATAEPGKSAGYVTFVAVGLAMIFYYGLLPLAKTL